MPVTVKYSTGEPEREHVGVYACRIPLEGYKALADDVFLLWSEGKWWHLGSDQRYRGRVLGFIGPLQRKMQL